MLYLCSYFCRRLYFFYFSISMQLVPPSARGCKAFVSRATKRVQVELHGEYSISRLCALHDYCRRATAGRWVLVLVVTAVPCLVIALGVECIPLSAPNLGVDHALTLYLRTIVVVIIINFFALYPYLVLVPTLPGSVRAVFAVSAFAGCCAVAFVYALARCIGFPLPFTLLFGSPVNTSLLGALALLLWGPFLRRHEEERNDLIKYLVVICIQVTLTYVYPAYAFAFVQVSGNWQVLFALLLPLIKRVSKSSIGYIFRDRSDIQSDMVVLNADIYHVIFVSWCMNSSRSTINTVLFVSMDLVESALAIRHVVVILRELETKLHVTLCSKTLEGKNSVTPIGAARKGADHRLALLDLALAICDHDKANIKAHRNAKLESDMKIVSLRWSSAAVVHAVSLSSASPETIELAQSNETTIPATNSTKEDTTKVNQRVRDLVASIPTSDRRMCLTLALRLLHISEFLLLVEFVEVIIPAVYGASTPIARNLEMPLWLTGVLAPPKGCMLQASTRCRIADTL